ncbi:MAG: hypothetical protein WAV41_01085 [Microgenomates group bacterium]
MARDILKGQKLQVAIVSIVMAIVLGLMSYVVMPKLTGLYTEMGVDKLAITILVEKYINYVVVGLIIFAGYIFSPNFMDIKFDERLLKYKEGSMISSKDLMISELQWLAMLLIGLVVGLLVVAIILPIYGLTTKIG